MNGLDSSATMTFARLEQIATARRVAAGADRLSRPPSRAGCEPLVNETVRRFPRVQEGLDWMEEDALAGLAARPGRAFGTRLTAVMSEANATRLLASLPMDVVPAGTVLMVQGEPAVDALLLEEGRVAIHIGYPDGHAVTLRLEGPGVLIGEMAFLFGMRRRATVTTETPCRLRRLTRDGLARLNADSPELAVGFHRLVARMLGDRLQDNDRMVASLVRGLRPAEDA